jgi:hypothetical protein
MWDAHFRKFRNLTEAKRKRAKVRANHMTWLYIRPRILKEYANACRMDSRYRDDIGHFCRGKIENLLTRHPQRYLVFHFPRARPAQKSKMLPTRIFFGARNLARLAKAGLTICFARTKSRGFRRAICARSGVVSFSL